MSADFSVPATGRLEKINATHACPGDPPDKFMAAGCQNKQRAENTIKYTKRCFRPAYSGSVLCPNPFQHSNLVGHSTKAIATTMLAPFSHQRN